MHVVKHFSNTLPLLALLAPSSALALPTGAGDVGEHGLMPHPVLNTPGSAEVTLASRDIRTFNKKWRLGVSVASMFFGGVGIYSLTTDCKDYSEKKEGEIGMKCVVAALASAAGIGSFVSEGLVVRADLADHFTSNGVQVPGINGNMWGGKRSDLIARLEADYSESFGGEVRHIGTLPETATEKRKRELAGVEHEPREVFGTTLHGREFHFADMGEAQHGRHVRVGHGPGPNTPANKRRLRARDGHEVFNDQFFGSGGLDLVLTRPALSDTYSRWDPQNSEQFQGAVDYWECALNDLQRQSMNPILQGTFGLPDQFDPHVLNFQMVNIEGKGTEIAGVIAAFKPGINSEIDKYQPKGGIESPDTCNAM